MPSIEKSILRPGRTIDGLHFTPTDLRHLYHRGQDLLAAGVQLPVRWAFRDTGGGIELNRATHCRNTLGSVAAFNLSRAGLSAVVELPNEEDAARIDKLPHLCPEIDWDTKDGYGRVWAGPSILELSAEPPMPKTACLSLGQRVRLSLGDFEPGTGAGAALTRAIEALAVLGVVLPDDVCLGTPEERARFLGLLEASALTAAACRNKKGAAAPRDPSADLPEFEHPSPLALSMSDREPGRQRVTFEALSGKKPRGYYHKLLGLSH